MLGEPDENALGASDVAEPIHVFVLDHFADELRAVSAEPGQRLVEVVHPGSPAWAELVDPPLSCTQVDYYQCGLEAADLLLQLRDGAEAEQRTVYGRYVPRASVGRAPERP